MENKQKHISKTGKCSACGTAPINHRLSYFESIGDEILNIMSKTIFGWIKISSENPLTDIFMAGFVNIFVIFGQAKYSNDITKVASGRSELIWKEAVRRGIKMQQIIMFKKPLEQYRAKINNRWVYFQSIPIPPWLSQSGYEWLDDKFMLAEKLNKNGINAPKAKKITTLKKANSAFDEMQKPVIIKPCSGSRGRHTTTNINTQNELSEAFLLGKAIANTLVVEEHLFGSVYRATVIDKNLVGFFCAEPPKITGDGIHTIKELIEIKNKNKPEVISDIKINDDVLSFISRKNYSLDSIIPEKEILDLSAKTGRFFGGYTKEMLPEIHPKFHEIFKKAGEVVQAPIVGFDLIAEDPTKDPDTQKWGVIECNSMPYIDLHYFAYEGKPIDLSKNIWDLWEKKK